MVSHILVSAVVVIAPLVQFAIVTSESADNHVSSSAYLCKYHVAVRHFADCKPVGGNVTSAYGELVRSNCPACNMNCSCSGRGGGSVLSRMFQSGVGLMQTGLLLMQYDWMVVLKNILLLIVILLVVGIPLMKFCRDLISVRSLVELARNAVRAYTMYTLLPPFRRLLPRTDPEPEPPHPVEHDAGALLIIASSEREQDDEVIQQCDHYVKSKGRRCDKPAKRLGIDGSMYCNTCYKWHR